MTSLARATFFPLSLNDLLLFASHLFLLHMAPATIQTYIFALCFIDNLVSGKNLAKSFMLRKMLVGIQRSTDPKVPRLPITAQIMHSLLQIVSSSSVSAYCRLLYIAMFLTAFHCFLRVGEFTARSSHCASQIIQYSDVSFISVDNSGAFQLSLKFFKGNTSRLPFNIVVQSNVNSTWCPVTNLRLYMFARGSSPGPLFCHQDLSPISRAEFSFHLESFLKQAGLDSSHIKPHSFRIGAATTACMNGVSEEVIQRLGRWRSNAYQRYIRMPKHILPT